MHIHKPIFAIETDAPGTSTQYYLQGFLIRKFESLFEEERADSAALVGGVDDEDVEFWGRGQ